MNPFIPFVTMPVLRFGPLRRDGYKEIRSGTDDPGDLFARHRVAVKFPLNRAVLLTKGSS